MDDEEIEDRLEDSGKSLEALPEGYHAFGPYWWVVKSTLRRGRKRRAWFSGAALDRELLEAVGLDPSGELPEDLRKQLLREAFFYHDLEAEGGMPLPELHLVDGVDGALIYQLQDPDAGRQLDLFEEVENQERRREQFLRHTASYLPGPWLQSGDEAVAAEESHRGVARYKRALLVAHDEESRLQGWLRIGTALNEAGHHTKAIVAFEQAYRRGKEGWILGLIGQAALEAGRYGEAAQQFRSALESMPGNPEYQAGLEAARERLAEQDRELAIS